MSNKPTKILLVEDNPGDANLLREMLNPFHSDDLDFELAEAPRLVAAINRLQESCFDVVLLDLSLPDSQGIATVARVRETRPTLPIIVLTGQDNDELATEALRRGARFFATNADKTCPLPGGAIPDAGAIIAGLVGGGGLGTFVFLGAAQTATDLILLGTIPIVVMALFFDRGTLRLQRFLGRWGVAA